MTARGRSRLRRACAGPALAAALLLPALAATARAAEPAPPPRVLTLEDVRRLALERSHDVRKAELYGAGVRGRYLEEKSAALPQLNLRSGYSHQGDGSALQGDGDTDVLSVAAGLAQPLYTWGRIPAAIRAAEVGLATAADRLRQARQAALRDALVAWYDGLLATEMESLAARNLAQKERLLGEARRKLAAGTMTDYDVLAAEVSVANARPDLIRAQNLVRTTRERLRFLLGLEEGTPLSLSGSLDAPGGELPPYPETLAAARRNRPDLAELRNRRKIAEEVVTITRAGTKPRLDAQASGGWQRLEVDGAAAHGAVWSAGVSFTMPLYDGRRTAGLVMQAESEAATLADAETELSDGIAVELRRAVDAVEEAAGIVAASAGTVVQAERLVAMAEKGFEHGVKTRMDVDDAQLNLNQARASLARARRDYLAARTSCDWVAGTLGE